MKICWDNLEKLKYSKRTKKWYMKNSTYIYFEYCKICGDQHISRINSEVCSLSCSNIKNKKGKKISKQHKNKISLSLKGKKRSDDERKNISEGKKGNKNPSWKGGVTEKDIPLFDTYSNQIDWCEEVRRDPKDENILQVKCTYCGKWYTPKILETHRRIGALNGKILGELRFYCSTGCKKECPIFNKHFYSADDPRSNKKQYAREVQPELRQMVFKRDNWECQKCKSKKSLHCHHKEGIRWEPLESADMDMCMTVCKKCHKKIHKKEGCKYSDMKCNIEIKKG